MPAISSGLDVSKDLLMKTRKNIKAVNFDFKTPYCLKMLQVIWQQRYREACEDSRRYDFKPWSHSFGIPREQLVDN